ncbi:MAG: GNAT family N-acetyltransferase [Marmoricola sp.]
MTTASALELPEVVGTRRLRLPVITPEQAADMRTGRRHPSWHPDFPREDDVDGSSAPSVRGWGSRLVVRAFDGLVCGTIGFFGPPETVEGAPGDAAPETEVGYGLVAEARGHGLATEALQALLALTDDQGVRIRAGVEPENRASMRVLTRCGFTQLRGTTEAGELVMVRPVPIR